MNFFLDIHANPVYMYRTSQVHVKSLSPYIKYHVYLGLSWPWLYGSWIYNYLCDQCLSPLKLWVRPRSWRGVLDTTLCDKVCQWLVTGWWFSPGTLVSSTNKTDHHKITEILLKVALSTINYHVYFIFITGVVALFTLPKVYETYKVQFYII